MVYFYQVALYNYSIASLNGVLNMKKIVAFTAVALCVSSAFGQEHFAGESTQAYGGQGNQAYGGQGVAFTQRVTGKIMSVSPIVRNVPSGQVCSQPQDTRVQPQSNLNPGTVIGALVGGLVLNQVGGGNGKTIATAVGAAGGAIIGNDYYQYRNEPARSGGCETTFEQRTVGWNYTAQYNGIQVQGAARRQPQIGEDVQLVMSSTLQVAQ